MGGAANQVVREVGKPNLLLHQIVERFSLWHMMKCNENRVHERAIHSNSGVLYVLVSDRKEHCLMMLASNSAIHSHLHYIHSACYSLINTTQKYINGAAIRRKVQFTKPCMRVVQSLQCIWLWERAGRRSCKYQ